MLITLKDAAGALVAQFPVPAGVTQQQLSTSIVTFKGRAFTYVNGSTFEFVERPSLALP